MPVDWQAPATPDTDSGTLLATSNLAMRIAALERKDTLALRSIWKAAWRKPAPKGARKRFLMLGIAWKWQADVLGGYDSELARRLVALEVRAGPGPKDNPDVARAARPLPGTCLIREWGNERHEVYVTERGYLWRDKAFGSLSAVAKEITGNNQNGQRFFGLRNKRKRLT